MRKLAWAGAVLLAALLFGACGTETGSAELSIAVEGNRFIDGEGQVVRPLGVNRPGPEYACRNGGLADGPGVTAEDPTGNNPLNAGDAATIASWRGNTVRVPLNQDCWLGLHGRPGGALSAGAYRQAIEDYVAALNAEGMYAILDLHWTNPGNLPDGDGLHAMPDADSVAFWTSVAERFAADPAVLFDVFNEPYSPAYLGHPEFPVDWACWRDGGCAVPVANDLETVEPAETYTAVGMQDLVDAIRAAGAGQPILVGGLAFANDLSGWLEYMPVDPEDQLAASFHDYSSNQCASESCWDATIAPVAAQVPLLTGEFGESDCPASGLDPDNFDNTYMDWADAHGIGYLGWGWFVLEAPQPCSALYLVTDYDGTPAEPNGVALKARLAELAEGDGGGLPGGEGLAPPAGDKTEPVSAHVPAVFDPEVARRRLQHLVDRRPARTVGGLVRAGGWYPRFRAPE